MATKENPFEHLPNCAGEYIAKVVRRIGNTRRVRREVRRELIDHFAHALRDCADEAEKDSRAQQLIEEFGEAKLLAKLIRRGKKRCRSLWKKAIVRGFQALGAIVVLYCLHTLWFVSGRPTISVDYLAILNQRGRAAAAETENAWENYKRAIDLYVAPGKETKKLAHFKRPADYPEFASLTPAEQAGIKQWLGDNEQAWQQLVAGSRRRHSWMEYSTGMPDEPLIGVFLPSLSHLRALVKVGVWRSRIAMKDGKVQEVLEPCLVALRAAGHLQRPNTHLIEQLVGIAMSELAHQQILHLAASGKLSAEDLAWLQRHLEAVHAGGYPHVDLEFERLTLLDMVQRCFTKGGPGGGHLIPREVVGFGLVFGGSWGEFEDRLLLAFGGMVFAGRDETAAKGAEYYKRLNEIIRLSPYEKRQQGLADWAHKFISGLEKPKFLFLSKLLPVILRAGDLACEGKALHEATIAVLALKRWRLEKGRYPENLPQLVAGGYLKALPGDPYDDGPLKYERRGEDFILYSMGRDFKDDGGVPAPGPGSLWGEEGGDRVFWPVR